LFLVFGLFSCSSASTKNELIKDNLQVNDDSISNEIIKPIYPEIDKKYLLGKFNPENDTLFVVIPPKYCLLRVEYIHRDVLEPFIAMYEAAEKDGVKLGIVSAVRTFNTQKWLWNQRYYNSSNPVAVAKSVLSYLAMPGTSRHHWGTDVDVSSTKLSYFETETGKESYQWMFDNAHKFGFHQVYTKDRTAGYNEEKWHWSYMPVAIEFQKQYREKITYDDLTGFNGSEVAKELNVINDYVFGIDSLLLIY
jgi:zinc D-Ala-D-Ala carboxypeptidase